METIEYPLTFEPLYEQGDGKGDMLQAFLRNKRSAVPPDDSACSWELLDSPQHSSVVANGPLQGTSLRELVRTCPETLVGKRQRPETPFPVCLRLLQTSHDRQLGVFPESVGRSHQQTMHSNFRFWYSLAAEEDAVIISGIKPGATRLAFMQRLNSTQLGECLQVYHPAKHSAFFAPSGRVHALGKGNLVLELQQQPADPRPVSGWGDNDAVPREKAEAAMAMVNFHDRQIRRIAKDVRPARQTRKLPMVPRCPAFRVDEIHLRDPLYGRTSPQTFHLVVLIEGNIDVRVRGDTLTAETGRPILMPAALGDYRVQTPDESALLLRISLPV